MKMICDHTELISILENNQNICQASADFSIAILTGAQKGDFSTLPEAITRFSELLVQAVKSSNAIINQIRERNE